MEINKFGNNKIKFDFKKCILSKNYIFLKLSNKIINSDKFNFF